ncbi:MAG: hypothetical protein R6V53_03010 [Candidatus Woesearchaeota archaeon]
MRWILLLLICQLGFAQVTMEKVVDPVDVGDDINVRYEITNKFNSEITVTLTDKNIIGDEGFVIECLQFSVPPNTGGELDLERNRIDTNFTAPYEGNFDLGTATITFKNPEFGIIESVSDNATISITGEGKVAGSMTRINLCNEEEKEQQQQQQQEMKDQMPKEEAMEKKQEQQKSQEEQYEEMQQQYQQQDEIDKKLQKSQQSMTQDTRGTKESLQKSMERRKEQERELQEALDNNSRLQDRLEEMKGYEVANKSLQPRGNKTGDFEYNMDNGTHETSLRGSMRNGSLEKLIDPQKMKEQLSENDHYQELKEKIESEGFKPQSFDAKEDSFTEEFEDKNGNTKTISGEGNLTKTKDFSVDTNFKDAYLIKQLEQDKKYQKISGSLEKKGYEERRINQEDSFVEFTKGNETRRVYYSLPDERDLWESFLHTMAVGFDYLFRRQ